jgi:PAS domain S-box-containing protein
MNWQYTPYVLPLIASTLITCGLIVAAWQRRNVPSATGFVWLMGTLLVWLLSQIVEAAGTDLRTVLFWNNTKFLGIAFLPVAYLAFVLQYTGRERWLTPLNLALSAVVPCITQLMIWTNAAHGLFRYNIRLSESGPVLNLQATSGAWYWAHTAYSYIFLVLGTALLVQIFSRPLYIHRRQAGTLLIGALVPWVANAVYIFVFDQFLPMDPTPFAFTVTGIAFAWGLFRFRLLEIVPAARNAVIEGMSDGVIVLDTHDRVIDLNPAARRIIGRPAEDIFGQSIELFLSGRPDLIERYRGVAEMQAEITLEEDKKLRYYDMRLSSLYDQRQRCTGRLIVLRDINDRKQAEEALQRWVAQLRVIPEIASDIATSRDLDELLDRSIRLIQGRLALSCAGIFLSDEQGKSLVLKASAGEPGSLILRRGHQLRVSEAGLVGAVIKSGRFQHLSGGDQINRLTDVSPSQPHTQIAFPLRVGQRITGALDVHSAQDTAFDEASIAVLQAVADQLAVAVENARLIQEMQRTLREADKAYGRYTWETWRRSARSSQRAQGYRFRQRHVEPSEDLPPETVEAWQQGRCVVTTVQPGAEVNRNGAMGALAVPIALRGQVIGALNLRFEGEHVASETVALVQEVANRLALTLENVRLLEESQHRAARERMTREVTARMRETLDVESVLQTTIREVRERLGLAEAEVWIGMDEISA